MAPLKCITSTWGAEQQGPRIEEFCVGTIFKGQLMKSIDSASPWLQTIYEIIVPVRCLSGPTCQCVRSKHGANFGLQEVSTCTFSSI